MKQYNGNIKNQIKILLWNKGNKNIINSIDEIRDMARKRKPEIMIIN